MHRVEIKAIGGGLLIALAVVLVSFAAYGLTVTDLGAHGGPYMIIGALMFTSIAVLLAVVGGRMIRTAHRASR